MTDCQSLIRRQSQPEQSRGDQRRPGRGHGSAGQGVWRQAAKVQTQQGNAEDREVNILLLNGLPEEYEGIPISAGYRNMIQVDMILRDPDLSDADKVAAALDQLYPEIPGDITKAINGLGWFLCGARQTAVKRVDAPPREHLILSRMQT